MPVLRKIARGVQDIRTHAGMSSEKKKPRQTCLRIACLEMEKFRRGQERQCAMRRVESIDSRCGEISAEQAVLMQTVAQNVKCRPAAVTPNPVPGRDSREPSISSPGEGFKIRY